MVCGLAGMCVVEATAGESSGGTCPILAGTACDSVASKSSGCSRGPETEGPEGSDSCVGKDQKGICKNC